MLEPYSDSVLWIVIVGFIVAFVLAFGIGANDVANSFGTSVGAKVLTVRQACYLATVFEIAGAILIGYKVSDTMRKGILDVTLYEGHEKEMMLGCLSSLIASGVWMMLATFLKLPISGTHSIVGATIGFSLVARGTQGLKWTMLGTIVASWFVSPLMSGLVSVIIYFVIRRCILHTEHPLPNGYRALPWFYGFTILINIFSIIHDGPKLLHMDTIPLWAALLGGLGAGILAAFLAWLLLVPHKSFLQNFNQTKPSFTMGSHDPSPANSPMHANSDDAKKQNEFQTNLQPVSESNENVCQEPSQPTTNTNGKFHENKALTNQPPAIDTKKLAMLASAEDCNSVGSPGVNSPKSGFQKEITDVTTNSLNNVDLTVTSLKYIDDTVSYTKSVDSNQTFEVPNSYDSSKGYLQNFAEGNYESNYRTEPPSRLKQLFQPLRQRSHSVSKAQDCENGENATGKVTFNNITDLNGHKPLKDHHGHRMSTGSIAIAKSIAKLQSIESGVSLVDMNPSLTPNSSAAPLIIEGGRVKKPGNNSIKRKSQRVGIHGAEEEMRSGIGHLFSFLQVLTATFGSFAHGGNDVSNAIGPLVALWLLYAEGVALQKSETPLLILFYGGIGISVGLWLWGRRVIQTVGEDLTEITPSTGFTIEVGAALTVLIASKVGLPISTTHCKVGSVVFVGYAKGKSDGVDWKIFRNIIFAWVVTVPIAGLISALCMYILKNVAL